MSRRLPWICVLATLLAVSDSSNQVFAAGTACPLYPSGQWNGRFYYYALSTANGNECGGSATMASDTVSHTLGCNGNTCYSPITTGSVLGGPIHVPKPFSGAVDARPTIDSGHPHDPIATVHSEFTCLVKLRNQRAKQFRVILLTHPSMRIPFAISQEIEPSSVLHNEPPISGGPLVATTVPYTGGQMWQFNVPMSYLHDRFISEVDPLRPQFDTAGSMEVVGVSIRSAFETYSAAPSTAANWADCCQPACSRRRDLRVRRRACR